MIMIYNPSERLEVKQHLWETIAQHPDVTIQGHAVNLRHGSLDEITAGLYAYLLGTNLYADKKNDIDAAWRLQNPADLASTDYRIRDSSRRQLSEYENHLNSLRSDLDNIVKEFANEKVKGVLDIEASYALLSSAHEIGNAAAVDQWINGRVNDILSRPFLRDFLENTYAETLQEDYLKKTFDALTTPAAPGAPAIMPRPNLAGQALRDYLFEHEAERKGIADALNYVNIAGMKTAALEKIKGEVNRQSTELKNTKKEYDRISDELKAYHPAAHTDINGSILGFFNSYGDDLLSHGIGDSQKKNLDYQKIYNAWVSHKVNSRHAAVQDYIQRALIVSDLLMGGNLEHKKNALKTVKTLQAEIESIKPDAAGDLNDFLLRTYKNAIMSSALDLSESERDFEWAMFDEKEKPVDHHDPGTYAQAGLGYYYRKFVQPFIAGAQAVAGGVSISRLEKNIVEKHKRRSSWLYGGFFNRKKKNRISVKEVLTLGLGYATEKNRGNNVRNEIRNKWEAVLHLNANSAMAEIISVYGEAADLGEELNDKASSWTYRYSTGYDEIDDEVNELAGSAFGFTDKARGFVNKLLRLGRQEELLGRVRTDGYDVDKETAIEPNEHPHLKAAAIIGTGALAAYVAVEKIWDELNDETKPISSSLTEVVKEIGVIAGFRAAEKALGKPPAPVVVSAPVPAGTAHGHVA